MDVPFKKLKRTYALEKDAFVHVLPFLFPGFYGHDRWLAFRTFLALTGVCRATRYWNLLRRWVAYLTPMHLRKRLKLHSFSCVDYDLWTKSLDDECIELLRTEVGLDATASVLQIIPDDHYRLFFGHKQHVSQMDVDVGGIPFFNVMLCSVSEPRCDVRCFYAGSFAEMVLFAYAVCKHVGAGPDDGWLLIATWKVNKYRTIYIKERDKDRLLNRSLLGRLKRIGMTAPQDAGFHNGGMEWTQFGWFCKHCDTTGTRNKASPMERLEQFVITWFRPSLMLTETQKKEAPHVFSIEADF